MSGCQARWDEALSGAAAGVALAVLGGDTPDDTRVRWSAVRAGYPHAVIGRAVAASAQGAVPDVVRTALIAEGRAGRDVGLVRARGANEDVWVLLVAEPRADVGIVPRELAAGTRVPLAPGPSWRAARPGAGVETLDGVFVPDAPGTWLLQATDAQGPVATLPVFVDVPTPDLPPLRGVPAGASIEARVEGALGGLRVNEAPPTRDPSLASIARARLRALLEHGDDVASAPDVARQLVAAGFDDGGTAGACRAPTVEACLEAMWWSPEDRGALDPSWPLVGTAASVEEGRVSVVVVTAR
jgi:hypothetical protein